MIRTFADLAAELRRRGFEVRGSMFWNGPVGVSKVDDASALVSDAHDARTLPVGEVLAWLDRERR